MLIHPLVSGPEKLPVPMHRLQGAGVTGLQQGAVIAVVSLPLSLTCRILRERDVAWFNSGSETTLIIAPPTYTADCLLANNALAQEVYQVKIPVDG